MFRKNLLKLLATIASLTFPAASIAEDYFYGVVNHVSDGDTAIVRSESGEVKKIRFYGIDAPESEWEGKWAKQPGSQEAKAFAKALLNGKKVKVRLTGDKTYSREVGEIFLDNNISASDVIVKEGWAWWNSKYARRDSSLKHLEQRAKSRKAGIWAKPNPTPPWEWRRQ